MKTFEFKLHHNSGPVTMRLKADNLERAKDTVLSIEQAPESAIKSWRVVPTAKQIRQTQNMMRGI